LWDKAQAGAVVEAPDHQIAQVVHKVLDPHTGEVSGRPEPQPTPRTHLASRLVDRVPAAAEPAGLAWSHELECCVLELLVSPHGKTALQ